MMIAPAAKFATVIHLATGHVLAAISSVGPGPELEDVTAGTHVRVRTPATDGFVNVPVTVLTATRIAVNPTNADVLDRPQHYALVAGTPPPLGPRRPPVTGTFVPDSAHAGAKGILVWQAGDVSVVEDVTLDAAGNVAVTKTSPTGVTHALLAIDGGPLVMFGELT